MNAQLLRELPIALIAHEVDRIVARKVEIVEEMQVAAGDPKKR